jgi:hypothetical protein
MPIGKSCINSVLFYLLCQRYKDILMDFPFMTVILKIIGFAESLVSIHGLKIYRK